jgi:membrane protease subunit (stomatin/prohibitin family)
MVGCGVYGQFAFRVTDPAKLILEFVGTRGLPSNKDIILTIRDRMLKVTRAIVNTRIVESGWDVLRVTSGAYNADFERDVLTAMPDQLACYGLELTAMQDFVITVLPNDKPKIQEIYDRRAKMKLAENDSYSEMATAELLLGAADGLKSQGSAGAGNMAGIGIGVGVGMGLAGKLVDDGPVPAAAAPAPAEATAAVAVTRSGGVCATCGAALPPGARFCSDCGTRTAARTCPACGEVVPSGRFCSACGQPMDG